MNYKNLKNRIGEIAEKKGIAPENLCNDAWYFLLKKYLLSEWDFEGDRGTMKLKIIKVLFNQPDHSMTDNSIFSCTTQMRQIICRTWQEKSILPEIINEMDSDGLIMESKNNELNANRISLTGKGLEVAEMVFFKVYQL
jgi:hypothetical protein